MMAGHLQTIAFLEMNGGEMLILMFIGLLVFGRRLPEVARNLGKSLNEFKKGMTDFQSSADEAVSHVEKATNEAVAEADGQTTQTTYESARRDPMRVRVKRPASRPRRATGVSVPLSRLPVRRRMSALWSRAPASPLPQTRAPGLSARTVAARRDPAPNPAPYGVGRYLRANVMTDPPISARADAAPAGRRIVGGVPLLQGRGFWSAWNVARRTEKLSLPEKTKWHVRPSRVIHFVGKLLVSPGPTFQFSV